MKFLLLFFLFALTQSVTQKQVIDCVRNQLGKPYVYGEAGPDSFDNAGLAFYCHNSAIPRIERAIAYGSGQSITNIDSVQPGDLMFWYVGENFGYLSICSGDGKMIYVQTGENVKEVTYEETKRKFLFAKRYWS